MQVQSEAISAPNEMMKPTKKMTRAPATPRQPSEYDIDSPRSRSFEIRLILRERETNASYIMKYYQEPYLMLWAYGSHTGGEREKQRLQWRYSPSEIVWWGSQSGRRQLSTFKNKQTFKRKYAPFKRKYAFHAAMLQKLPASSKESAGSSREYSISSCWFLKPLSTWLATRIVQTASHLLISKTSPLKLNWNTPNNYDLYSIVQN